MALIFRTQITVFNFVSWAIFIGGMALLSTINVSSLSNNPLTAGAAYIRFFIFYLQYNILNMLKIKCDINPQDLKRVDLHFVKSE